MSWTRCAKFLAVAGLALLPLDRVAAQTTFDVGSIVIPMDPTHQDDGILDAYGLVHALLAEGVHVHWIIDPTKAVDGADLEDLSTYLTTEAPTAALQRSFAGGPFMIDSIDATDAELVIDQWQADGWSAIAYFTDADIDAEVSRTLHVAPTIAIFEDGEEDIAWSYLNAAGIPDALGNTWDGSSPGNLSEAAITGVDDSLVDGALIAADGLPAYCHLNLMHWDESDAEAVVMEIRQFAEDPLTSSLFECKATLSVENEPTYGMFLSSGIAKIGLVRNNATYEVGDPSAELLQVVGDWGPASGSLPDFDGTFDSGVVLVTGDDGTDVAQVVASGHVDDDPAKGNVSLLGGHDYDVGLPYSSNDEINGVRVFLNSYFTADCADLAQAPLIALAGTPSVVDQDVTLVLDHANTGAGPGRTASLVLEVPAGLTYVSDDGGGVWDAGPGTVTWDLETIDPGETGSIETELSATASGNYLLVAELEYHVEATAFTADWSDGVYVLIDTDGDGLSDEDETDVYGTDPNDADTDDGGVNDGDEIDNGTDPLDGSDDFPGDDDDSAGDDDDSAGDDDDTGDDDTGDDDLDAGEVAGGCKCALRSGRGPAPWAAVAWVLALLLGWRHRRGRAG